MEELRRPRLVTKRARALGACQWSAFPTDSGSRLEPGGAAARRLYARCPQGLSQP